MPASKPTSKLIINANICEINGPYYRNQLNCTNAILGSADACRRACPSS